MYRPIQEKIVCIQTRAAVGQDIGTGCFVGSSTVKEVTNMNSIEQNYNIGEGGKDLFHIIVVLSLPKLKLVLCAPVSCGTS